ncbi:tRNA 2-selenouridine(34) synthase MnmH [Synechococcus sp. RSCCF101]|uniref:tRNA 2-selenouridine(34) synthase MnmH n=1 Tax=Synechococcus sp. RSCCF101 TaxID=2511069 RepID=UPI00124867ED|nr:tRNA 2-selenouridine(34) synthase MnmH [Synechococcus sp. RSCCF101]QEY31588.1 tRNA 2-selenouridine(34) synthase MnmH [Synechococcus sp. RSCCF101]
MAQCQEVSAFLAGSGALLDVRSPSEHAQGRLPGSRNLPLFDDAERAAVGTAYKQQGRQQAIQLGLELVGPRLGALAEELRDEDASQPLRLYCWRGGMRSASVAWLAETVGREVRLLEGGYKRFRRWVLDAFAREWPLRVLAGRTGTGKTALLQALAARGVAVVDLEGLAQHRGSSFGGLGLPPQPSSEQFENRLALALHAHRDAPEIWLEAESAQIGRCRLPLSLFRSMGQAPTLEILRPRAWRLDQLVSDYGHHPPDQLREATLRIQRRLGPQRTAMALTAIDSGCWAEAAEPMLAYYDRCYDHELQRRPKPDSIDLEGLPAAAAAELLIRRGHCHSGSGSTEKAP